MLRSGEFENEAESASFETVLYEKTRDKLRKEWEYYSKEAISWAEMLVAAGLAEHLKNATPEMGARRDSSGEMMVMKYYGKEVEGACLTPMVGVIKDGSTSIPRVLAGPDRDSLIREVESREVNMDGVPGRYVDGSNFFVINKTDDRFNPVDGEFVARYLKTQESE